MIKPVGSDELKPLFVYDVKKHDALRHERELREEVQEFCARDSKAEKKPFVPRFGRRDKVSRSTGLENLKVTLNLARGDLEVSFAF